jgi:hypothetical protein
MKSEFKFWRWAAVIGVLVLGIVGSIAVAAPKGGGGGSSSNSDSSSDPGRPSFDVRFETRGPGRELSALAKELGVTTSKLREALKAAFEEVGPPEPPADGDPPSKADFEKHCKELTDALAKELGKSGDEVRGAIKSVMKKRIEAAVDAEKLTRAEADRIIKRIDDSECAGPLKGIGGPGGCHGGPGKVLRFHRGGPPGDFERPAAPPDAGAGLAL